MSRLALEAQIESPVAGLYALFHEVSFTIYSPVGGEGLRVSLKMSGKGTRRFV
jgi:hypothetical protein